MLRIQKTRSVLYPVVVERLTDGGGVEKQQFKVRYRLLDRKRLQERYRESVCVDERTMTAALRRRLDPERQAAEDAELLDHVEGWEDVADEHGAPIPYDRALCLQLMEADTAFWRAMHDGLLQASQESPAKN